MPVHGFYLAGLSAARRLPCLLGGVSTPLHARTALEFVREHGVVLASAKGDAPRLIQAILGEPITGNWWSHPKGGFIYNVLSEVSDSEDILVCRLLHGKITLIHRRLWPALVRVAGDFEPARIAKVRDEHTSSGRHVTHEVAFPLWVPPEVRDQAVQLSEQQALSALGTAVEAAHAALRRRGAQGKTVRSRS